MALMLVAGSLRYLDASRMAGFDIAQVRGMLLSLGWTPIDMRGVSDAGADDAGEFVPNHDAWLILRAGFPEVSHCNGMGAIYCLFHYRRGAECAVVVTRGEWREPSGAAGLAARVRNLGRCSTCTECLPEGGLPRGDDPPTAIALTLGSVGATSAQDDYGVPLRMCLRNGGGQPAFVHPSFEEGVRVFATAANGKRLEPEQWPMITLEARQGAVFDALPGGQQQCREVVVPLRDLGIREPGRFTLVAYALRPWISIRPVPAGSEPTWSATPLQSPPLVIDVRATRQ